VNFGVLSKAHETTERARHGAWFKNMFQPLLPGFDGKRRFWKKPDYMT
jgi:hypothetical protein